MKKVAVAGLLAALVGAASAQVYVGVASGQSEYVDVDCDGAQSCQKNGVGYKVYGGYHINPEVALEAAYVSFGRTKGVVPESGYLVNIEGRSRGVLLDGVYRHAMGPRVSLVGDWGLP